MTPWIEAIALWLADFYLAATILLIIAGAVLCFIQQPARRMAVAWGTLVSLLVAALLCQSASRPRVDPRQLFTREEQPAVPVESTERHAAEPPVSEIPFAPRQPVRQEQMDPPQEVDSERTVDAVTKPEITIERPSAVQIDTQTIAGGAVLLFLTGAVLMGARLAVGAWRASRLIRHSLAAPPRLVDELRAIVGDGARSPRLRLNVRLVTPVATGALWPTIVLPERFAENSQHGELLAVLGHEWAHIRNGDLWLLALDRCLFPVLWAHPVYWWLRRRMRQDQEFLADAAAASLIGPADYAAQLVAWARDLAGVRRIVVSNAVGIWERPSGFALRISTILDRADRITLRCSGRVRVVTVAGLAAASLIAASVSVRPPNAESAPPESKAIPEETRAELSKTDSLALGADEVGGTCVDPQQAPVAGAQVFLYCVNSQDLTQRLVQQTSTDAAGQFKFTHLAPRTRTGDHDIVVARRHGLATSDRWVSSRGKRLDLVMPKAATFRGTVRDAKGKPVAGAQVSFRSAGGITFFVRPLEGIRCARTNAKGEFAVDDLSEFTEAPVPRPDYHGSWDTTGPASMAIVHPDYVQTRAEYTKVPGYLDVTLSDPAATITGQVFGETGRPAAGVSVALSLDRPRERFGDVAVTGEDGRYRLTSLPEGSFSVWVSASPGDRTADMIDPVKVHQGGTTEAPLMRLVAGGVINGRIINDITGKPAAGITVALQAIENQKGKASIFGDLTKTDGQGHYQFAGLPSGKFNIFLQSTGLDATAFALDSFEVRGGQTATAPPIHLIRGGLVKGRVIDDATGQPVIRGDDEYLDVQIHGPSRPWSGGCVAVVEIRKDGTFEVRLPPGENWLALRTRETFAITRNFGGDVSVPDGGEVEVKCYVKRMKPLKKADNKKTQTEKPVAARVVDATGRSSQKSASKRASSADRQWELRGTVVTQSGAPVGDVLVTVHNFPFVGTVRSAPDGRFSLMVPNAPSWTLMLIAKDPSGLQRGVYVYSATPPWPQSGPSGSPVRLVMKTAREIPVTVIDGGGQPIAGATVGACAEMHEVTTETSDSQGRAVLRVPADVELQFVFAVKPEIGLDYFAYHTPGRTPDNPYTLAADDTKPIKFVLNGARTARLRLVDGNQRPLAGVRVSPWYFQRPRKGRDFNVSAMETFTKTTNAAGGATFHIIPADNPRKTPFSIFAQDYAMTDRASFDPKATADEIRVVLLRKELVRGGVSFPDGRPAAGATVAVAGEGFGSESFQGETTCDERGQFEIRVVPDMFYAFVATSGRFVSPRRTCVVRAAKPIEPLRLVVQPGARVFGRWTLESENRPVARQSLVLYENVVNDDYRLIPKEARLPNPKNVRKYLVPKVLRRPRTDDQGRFELFVAPGSYYLAAHYFNASVPYGTRPLNRDKAVFEITDPKDFEINLRSAPLDRRDLAGRVVLKSDPHKAVANATIKGQGTEEAHMADYFSSVSNAQGRFRTRRAPSEMLVYGATEDRSLSAIVRITADAKDLVIPVGPTASAHGRLIDRSTGQPLAERVVASGIFLRWGKFSSWQFGSRTKTDARGEFVVKNLTPGWKWELRTEVTVGVGEQAFESPQVVGSVTPDSPALIELGDLKVSIPESDAAHRKPDPKGQPL